MTGFEDFTTTAPCAAANGDRYECCRQWAADHPGENYCPGHVDNRLADLTSREYAWTWEGYHRVRQRIARIGR
jgi:hypothetical protein